MHAFLLRLPAPPYLQGPFDLAVLSKSRQSVSHPVSQSVVSACPGNPISPARNFHYFLDRQCFSFLYLGSFHVFHLTLR